jgi:hypothetical protein
VARRTPTTRRKVGNRRTVVGGQPRDGLDLDDTPLEITISRDLKRLLVVLPYEVCVVQSKDLSIQRRIPLPTRQPSLTENLSGQLWIGGNLLHEGSSWGEQLTKLGSKLSGFVDKVCLLRPDLLCGAGSNGQLLWNLETHTESHRRKASEGEVTSLIATADERAIFTNGKTNAWVVDPHHPSGYGQLKFKETSPVVQDSEIIDRAGLTSNGRALLAARDGGIAVTHSDLRIDQAWFPRPDSGSMAPLAVVGDAHFIYVLRSHGRLQRFCYAAPPTEEGEPAPLEQFPPAEHTLEKNASCMSLLEQEGAPSALLLGGPRAQAQLGHLWRLDVASLTWTPIRLRSRVRVEDDASSESRAPSFVATKTKVDGPPLSSLGVDDVLRESAAAMISTARGAPRDRPYVALGDKTPLGADTLVMPAMFRLKEGTARPGLVVWSGTSRPDLPAPKLQFLTWGKDPSVGWIELSTPEIRAQQWSRGDVFPLQVAIRRVPKNVPGQRATIPRTWEDAALFDALARECRKAMKVLW